MKVKKRCPVHREIPVNMTFNNFMKLCSFYHGLTNKIDVDLRRAGKCKECKSKEKLLQGNIRCVPKGIRLIQPETGDRGVFRPSPVDVELFDYFKNHNPSLDMFIEATL